MAIVSVSSHSLSTRIDCSVFSLRRSKSSLMGIRDATGTFIYDLMRFYSKVCYVCPWKAKTNWALVRRNGFLKREVILRSSLLSSVNIFDGSSECAVFQNLVPEVYVQQLSLQAFINQKLRSLKKDASTSFLLVCSWVTGHSLAANSTYLDKFFHPKRTKEFRRDKINFKQRVCDADCAFVCNKHAVLGVTLRWTTSWYAANA